MKRICRTCNKEKELSDFKVRNTCHDGFSPNCKSCEAKKRLANRRTKNGLINRIYTTQKQSSKKRGFIPPTYTKQELHDWLFSQKLFHELFDNWKLTDYNKGDVPSVDRKDDYVGYTLSNIQLMTWNQNREKSNIDRKEGRNNKHSKVVLLLGKGGNVTEYHSVNEAARCNGIYPTRVSESCKGIREIPGLNFVFK